MESYENVLVQDESIWVAGRNNFGQLGAGRTTFWMKFVLTIPSGIQLAATGDQHSMVLKYDGSLWATRSNADGQLGDGYAVDRNRFMELVLSPEGALTYGLCDDYYAMCLRA